MAPTAPILDLGVLATRPLVRIEHKNYEMRTSNEFTYLVYTQFQRRFARLGALLTKRKKSKADWTEQGRLQDEFVRELLIAPDKVHARLGDFERLEIIKAFFSQVRRTTNGHGPASPRRAAMSAPMSSPGKK